MSIKSIPAYKFLGKKFFIYNSNPPDENFKRDLWCEIYKLKIESHGGKVSDRVNSEVTHILCLAKSYNFPTKAQFVDKNWVNSNNND